MLAPTPPKTCAEKENKMKREIEINERARPTLNGGSYDVIVVGGGVAGISAALAARRSGAEVLLLEREYSLGGLATLGLVTIYLPICDGMGHQVSFSIAEELLRLSISVGHEAKYPKPWLEGGSDEEKAKTRFQVRYNAAAFALLCEERLLSEGVKILYGSHVCAASVGEGGRIEAVIAEGVDGRSAYFGKAFVDASGDAVLAQAAGEETATYSPNVNAAWYYYVADGINDLKMLGYSENPAKKDEGKKRYAVCDTEAVSEFMTDGHAEILKAIREMGVSREKEISAISGIPQYRMTRRIVSARDCTLADNKKYIPDSVGTFSSWYSRGPVYEMPFRALCGRNISNLYAAGRIIGADDGAWYNTRVIPICAVSGEASGRAAAMLAREGKVDVGRLQDELRRAGVTLHVSEVL